MAYKNIKPKNIKQAESMLYSFYLQYGNIPDFQPNVHIGSIATSESPGPLDYFHNVRLVANPPLTGQSLLESVLGSSASVSVIPASAFNGSSCYAIGGHPELGSGCFLISGARQLVLALTEEFIDFLSKGSKQIPGALVSTKIPLSGTLTLSSQVQLAQKTHAKTLSRIGILYGELSGASISVAALKCLEILSEVEKIASAIDMSSELASSFDAVRAVVALGTGAMDSEMPMIVSIAQTALDRAKNYASIYRERQVGSLASISASMELLEQAQTVAFAPASPVLIDSLSLVSPLTAGDAYMICDMNQSAQPWIRTLEMLKAAKSSSFLQTMWPCLPFTLSDSKHSISTSDLVALGKTIDANNAWLFCGIYAVQLRTSASILNMYDPSGILVEWQNYVTKLNKLSSDISLVRAENAALFKIEASDASLLSEMFAAADSTFHIKYFASIYDHIVTLTSISMLVSNIGPYMWRLLYTLFNGKLAIDQLGIAFNVDMGKIPYDSILTVDYVRTRVFKTQRAKVPKNALSILLGRLQALWLRTISVYRAFRNNDLSVLAGAFSTLDFYALQRTKGDTVAIMNILIDEQLVKDFSKNLYSMPYEKDFICEPGAYGFVAKALSILKADKALSLALRYPTIVCSLCLEAGSNDSYVNWLYGGGIYGSTTRSIPLDPNNKLSIHIGGISGTLSTRGQVSTATLNNWSDTVAAAGTGGKLDILANWQEVHEKCLRAIYTCIWQVFPTTAEPVQNWLTRYKVLQFGPCPLSGSQLVGATDFNTFSRLLQKYGSGAVVRIRRVAGLSPCIEWFDTVFYPQTLFPAISTNSYSTLVSALCWTQPSITYLPGSTAAPIFQNVQTVVTILFFSLATLHELVLNGTLVPPNVWWALLNVLEKMSVSDSGSTVSLRNYVESLTTWKILVGREAGTPKEDLILTRSLTSAKAYIAYVAAVQPASLFGIHSVSCNPSTQSAEAYGTALLTSWSFGLDPATTPQLKISYIERPAPWNGYSWSNEKTRSITVSSAGAALEALPASTSRILPSQLSNVYPSFYLDAFQTGIVPMISEIPGSSSSWPSLSGSVTVAGFLVQTPSPVSGSTTSFGTCSNPVWPVAYILFSDSQKHAGLLRMSTRSNGLGIVFTITGTSAVIEPVRISDEQTILMYVDTELVVQGRVSRITVDATVPHVITLVTRIDGEVLDVSDCLLVDLVEPSYQEVIYTAPEEKTTNIYTLPGTVFSVPSASVMCSGSQVNPGPTTVGSEASITLVGPAVDLVGNVGYVAISYGTTTVYNRTGRQASSGILTVEAVESAQAGLVRVVAPDSFDWQFYIDGISFGSPSPTSSAFVSGDIPVLVVCTRGKKICDVLVVNGTAVSVDQDINVGPALSLLPMSGFGNLNVANGSYACVLFREAKPAYRDEIWNSLRGIWTDRLNSAGGYGELTSIDGAESIVFGPSVATYNTTTESRVVYIGAVSQWIPSTTFETSTENLYTEGYSEPVVFVGGALSSEPALSGDETFPNSNLYLYTDISTASEVPKQFVPLVQVDPAGGAYISVIPSGCAIWFLLTMNTVEIGQYVASFFGADVGKIGNTAFSSLPIADALLMKKQCLDDGLYGSWSGMCLKFGTTQTELEQVYAFDLADALIPLLQAGYKNLDPTKCLERAVQWGATRLFDATLQFVPGLSSPEDIERFVRSAAIGKQMNYGSGDTKRKILKIDNKGAPLYACSGNTDPSGTVTTSAFGDISFDQITIRAMCSLNGMTLRRAPLVQASTLVDTGLLPDKWIPVDVSPFYETGGLCSLVSVCARATSYATYMNFPTARMSITINDGVLDPNSREINAPESGASFDALFTGWKNSDYETMHPEIGTDSSFLIRDSAQSHAFMLHATEDGDVTYPSGAVNRNLFGCSSPWFATYVSGGISGKTALDPGTGLPIFNMSNDMLILGISSSGMLAPVAMRSIDLLLCPAKPIFLNTTNMSVVALNQGYYAFVQQMQNLNTLAAPCITLQSQGAADATYDVAKLATWQLSATSLFGSSSRGAYPLKIPTFVSPDGTFQPPLAVRTSANPETYSDVLLAPIAPFSASATREPLLITSITTHDIGPVAPLVIMDTVHQENVTIPNSSIFRIDVPNTGQFVRIFLFEDHYENIVYSLTDPSLRGPQPIILSLFSENNDISSFYPWFCQNVAGQNSTVAMTSALGQSDSDFDLIMSSPLTLDINFQKTTTQISAYPLAVSGPSTSVTRTTPPTDTASASIERILCAVAGIGALKTDSYSPAALLNGTDQTPEGHAVTTSAYTGSTTDVSMQSGTGSNMATWTANTASEQVSFLIEVVDNVYTVTAFSSINGVNSLGMSFVAKRPAKLTSMYVCAGVGVKISNISKISTNQSGTASTAKTCFNPYAALSRMQPRNLLADILGKRSHEHGPWMETRRDLEHTELFFNKSLGLPLPQNYLLGQTTLRQFPNIPSDRWVVVSYDLYGIPDESTDANRMNFSDIDTSALASLPITVGIPNGQYELIMTVPVAPGSAIDRTGTFRPCSVWGAVSGNSENLAATHDQRLPVVPKHQTMRAPFTLIDQAFKIGSFYLDTTDIYTDRISAAGNEKTYMHFGIGAGYRDQNGNATSPQTYTSIVLDGSDVSDLTRTGSVINNAALDGSVRGKLALKTLSRSLESGSILDSKIVYVPNRIVSVDVSSGFVTLAVPIPCAYNVLNGSSSIEERFRYVNVIHITKLVSMQSAGLRFYGSPNGMSNSTQLDDRRCDLVSIPVGAPAIESPKIALRPGLGAITTIALAPGKNLPEGADPNVLYSGIQAGYVVLGDVLNSLAAATVGKTIVTLVDGSVLPFGTFWTFNASSYPAIVRQHQLVGAVESAGSGIVVASPPFAGVPWNPDAVLVRSEDSFYRQVSPGLFELVESVAEPEYELQTFRSYNTYVSNGTVQTCRCLRARLTSPFPTDQWDGPYIDGSTMRLVYGNVSVPVTLIANQLGYVGTQTVSWNATMSAFACGSQLLSPGPAITMTSSVPSSQSSSGLYITMGKHVPTIYIVNGGQVTRIPHHALQIDGTWDPTLTSVDSLVAGKTYYVTESCGVYSAGTFVTPDAPSWFVRDLYVDRVSALLSETELFGVTQMRFSGIYTDPRTAALHMQTTRYPVQLAGPLGQPEKHYTTRMGKNCTHDHPYFALTSIMYSSPELTGSDASNKLVTSVGTKTSESYAWDTAVMRTIRESDILVFRSLVTGKENMFTTRFISDGFPYAFPVYDEGTKRWSCFAIDTLVAELTGNAANLAAQLSPSWTLVASMVLGVYGLAENYSQDSALAFMQIFEDICRICKTPPAEIALFLSISANIAMPNAVAESLVSVPAPTGFGFDGDVLSLSLLGALERIATGLVIDMFDQNVPTLHKLQSAESLDRFIAEESGTYSMNGTIYSFNSAVVENSASTVTFASVGGICVKNYRDYRRALLGPLDPGTPVTDRLPPPALVGALPSANDQDATFYDLREASSGMSFVELDDYAQSCRDLRAVSTYMARLLPRLSFRGACGGIASTQPDKTGSKIEYAYRWRSSAEAPWDFGWVVENGTPLTASRVQIDSSASGYVASSEFETFLPPVGPSVLKPLLNTWSLFPGVSMEGVASSSGLSIKLTRTHVEISNTSIVGSSASQIAHGFTTATSITPSGNFVNSNGIVLGSLVSLFGAALTGAALTGAYYGTALDSQTANILLVTTPTAVVLALFDSNTTIAMGTSIAASFVYAAWYLPGYESSLGAVYSISSCLTFPLPTIPGSGATVTIDSEKRLVLSVNGKVSKSIVGGITAEIDIAHVSAGNAILSIFNIVPDHDMYIYHPDAIETIVASVIVTYGVAFIDTRGKVLAVWSPINMAPFADQVPCLGNIKGPLVDSDSVALAVPVLCVYGSLSGKTLRQTSRFS